MKINHGQIVDAFLYSKPYMWKFKTLVHEGHELIIEDQNFESKPKKKKKIKIKRTYAIQTRKIYHSKICLMMVW